MKNDFTFKYIKEKCAINTSIFESSMGLFRGPLKEYERVFGLALKELLYKFTTLYKI